MITNEAVLRSPRLAGAVKRYHTWPTVTTQTNADHTYHVIRIYGQIFGPIPPKVTDYLVWHDAGEIKTGDLPYPVKSQNLDVKTAISTLEKQAVQDMGGKVVSISEEQQRRAKLADLVEMLEFGLMELQLGNQFATPVVNNMTQAVVALCAKGSDEDRKAVLTYIESLLQQFSGTAHVPA